MNYLLYFFICLFSFLTTFVFLRILIPRLTRFGISGEDKNKLHNPKVAEMGGIATVAGFTAGVLLSIFLNTFFGLEFNLIYVLAALITVHSISFIGIVDDLLDVPQIVKAFLPIFAAVPLVAVSAAGSTSLTLPVIGTIDLGVLYVIVLVPIGVAVASNLSNMFAGFNGLEAGLGSVIFSAMSLIALAHDGNEMLVLFGPMLGALIAFLFYNWYPARVFPGDVGNLTIGAVLAAGVIIGNAEGAGALLMILYVVDFFIKAYNRFPSSGWWGEFKGGKLYPYKGKIRGLAQLVMALCGGISEERLTLLFIFLQVIIAFGVLFLYL